MYINKYDDIYLLNKIIKCEVCLIVLSLLLK